MFLAFRTLEWTGFPRTAALLVATLGLTVLFGWALDVALIKSMLPGAMTMKVNAALCFLLAGSALFLHLQTSGWQRLVQGMALTVVVISLATLGEYMFDWQLGIDQLLFREPTDAVYAQYQGRMSAYTASGFSAASFALLALSRKPLRLPAQLVAGLTVLVGAIPLLGYLWNLSTLANSTAPVAVHTSLGLILLGIALLTASLTGGRATPLKTVESKVLLGFIGAMFLILLGGAITYRASTNFAESAQWVTHTQEVRAKLSDLYGSIVDAVSANRGYLLTGDKSQQAHYVQLNESMPALLETLAQLVSDKPAQMRNLATLRPLVEQRLQILDKVMAAYDSQGLMAAQQEITADKSLEVMNSILTVTKTMEAFEIQLLKEREAVTEQTRRFTLGSMLITLLLAVALLTTLFLAIRREMAARDKAEGYDGTHRQALLLYSAYFDSENILRGLLDLLAERHAYPVSAPTMPMRNGKAYLFARQLTVCPPIRQIVSVWAKVWLARPRNRAGQCM